LSFAIDAMQRSYRCFLDLQSVHDFSNVIGGSFMTSITSEKAMDLSIKMLERSDAYWTKAAVFATAAIAIKGLGVKIGKLAEVVDLKEVPGEVVVGILALVALFNVALAGVWGWQGSAIARFAPEEFKSTMARTGAVSFLPLVMAILAAIVLVIIVRRDVWSVAVLLWQHLPI
jgi:hypothetical protein